jgi:SAM-dependent methyltransferase
MKASVTKHNFFDTWRVYEEMLDHNYMFHDEIYRDVQRFLGEHYAARSFNVLDLGCGSARHMAAALRGCSLERYVGYDLSVEALAHARENLSRLNCRVELLEGDLLAGLKASDEPFDLIFSSFALHHLQSKDKAAFLRLACLKLKGNGILLMIDTVREEHEELALYLDRYCAWLRDEWTALSPAALDAFCQHIRHNDFPETMPAFQTMAADAGFQPPVQINRFRWHRTLCFEKK